MKYWLHRISHHAEVSYPLFEKGILSIGFADIGDIKFINKAKENWDYFEKSIEENWGYKLRARYSLWRFLYGMKKGDCVLVPSWGTFSLCEVLDDNAFPISELNTENLLSFNGQKIVKNNEGYLAVSGEHDASIDLGFFRNIKIIEKDISRYDYANKNLTSRMKVRQTNVEITDLKDDIEQSKQAFKEKRPINLYALILEKSLQSTYDIISKELNPDKLELLIKWYLEKMGATESVIPAKNESDKEGDADIVATFENIKTIIYVQAKYHEQISVTNDWALTQIEKYREYKADSDDGYSKIAWVISTAEKFSEECYNRAKVNSIQLFDGRQFSKMLLEAGISTLDGII